VTPRRTLTRLSVFGHTAFCRRWLGKPTTLMVTLCAALGLCASKRRLSTNAGIVPGARCRRRCERADWKWERRSCMADVFEPCRAVRSRGAPGANIEGRPNGTCAPTLLCTKTRRFLATALSWVTASSTALQQVDIVCLLLFFHLFGSCRRRVWWGRRAVVGRRWGTGVTGTGDSKGVSRQPPEPRLVVLAFILARCRPRIFGHASRI
jgi:hypothetical protein